MGKQSSTSEVMTEALNRAITNVLMENSSSCRGDNSQIQEMSITDITAGEGCSLDISGVDQTAKQSVNFSCAVKQENETSLATAFAQQLEQESNAAVSGIGGAVVSESNSKVIANLKNEIVNNINMKNVAECVNNTLQRQKLELGKYKTSCPAVCTNPNPPPGIDLEKVCTNKITDVSQEAVQEAVSECTMGNVSVNKIINQASSKIEQSSIAENTGVNPAVSASSSGISSFILLSIVASVAYSYFSSGGDTKIDIKIPNLNQE